MQFRQKSAVIVCGASFHSNFGDVLFAYMFHQRLSARLPNADVVFLKTGEFTRRMLGIRSATIMQMFKAKALVYMSGGLFCGLPPSKGIRPLVRKIRYYNNIFLYGLISVFFRRPIVLIGVEAGPLYGRAFITSAKRIFNAASLIVVRNQESSDFLREIGVTRDIVVSVDSALAERSFDFPTAGSSLAKPIGKTVIIHVTKSPAMEGYISSIVKAAGVVYGKDECVSFVVTDDYVVNNPWIEKAASVLPEGRTTIHQYHDPNLLLDLIKGCDTIITPKLHLGIYGCIYGKTVFSFPVHPEKTSRFYRQIGYEVNCNNMDLIDYSGAVRLFEERKGQRAQVPEEMKLMAEHNFALLDAFCARL